MKKNGFTLIEILASIGVLSIVGVLLTQVFVTTTRTNTKTEVSQEVKQNGDYAISVMSRMLQNAYEITSTCEAIGTTDSQISFDNKDGSSVTFSCDNTGPTIRIASNSAFLTNDTVTLVGADCTAALTIVCTKLPDERERVKILFTLAQTSSAPESYTQNSESFQATVLLRN